MPSSYASRDTLTPAQYADLHAVVKDTLTAADLIEKVQGLATAWGIPVVAERVGKLKDHIR